MLNVPCQPPRREKSRHYSLRLRKRNFWLGVTIGPIVLLAIASQVAQVDFRDQRALYFKVKQAQESVTQFTHDLKYLRTKVKANLNSEPERLVLDVGAEAWQSIVDSRNRALDRGLLITTSDDFVKARFTHDADTVNAKIRLKGDLLDHLKHPDRWSFRVKIRGENAYHGMRRFSLQPPPTRNYLHEWVFHRMVRDEGLIGLRYDFVNLTVNGNDLGVYAVEEHFAKQVIESHARREGPIVRFEEGTLWGVRQFGTEDAYLTAPISAFEMGSVLESPSSKGLFELAASRLEQVRAGELSVADVFHLERVAHYFAICDLLGAQHGVSYNNLRFYFDPVAGKFEPVAFDGIPGLAIVAPAETLANATGIDGQRFLRLFFAEPDFCAHYHQSLERVIAPEFLDAFLDRWQYELTRLETILHRQYPQVRFDPEVYRTNAETIARTLKQGPDLAIYRRGAELGDGFEVVNLQPRHAEITGAVLASGAFVPYRAPVSIEPYLSGVPSKPQTIAAPSDCVAGDSIVALRTAPSGVRVPKDITVEDFNVYRNLASLPRQSTARSIEWLEPEIRGDRTHFIVPTGSWTLDETLVLGEEERLIIAPGATIDLVRGAQILSFGGITAAGDEDDPITITSSDGLGLGVFVSGSPDPCVFRSVIFESLSHPRSGAWGLTGAVTVHESEVTFDRCRFEANRCEDALNLIRSTFELTRCIFSKTFSDALDCDFANGTISQTSFLDSGNDAIDTSGSEVAVVEVLIRGAGDKGISAGEGSTLAASEMTIAGVEIAVASKDDSTVRLTNLVIQEVALGFAVYNKKPEYGPGVVEASFSPRHRGGFPTYLLESASRLVYDGEEQSPNQENVVDDLYGVKYGKSSK